MAFFKSDKQKEAAKEFTKAVAQGSWAIARATAGPSGGAWNSARNAQESWRRGQDLLREHRQEYFKTKR